MRTQILLDHTRPSENFFGSKIAPIARNPSVTREQLDPANGSQWRRTRGVVVIGQALSSPCLCGDRPGTTGAREARQSFRPTASLLGSVADWPDRRRHPDPLVPISTGTVVDRLTEMHQTHRTERRFRRTTLFVMRIRDEHLRESELDERAVLRFRGDGNRTRLHRRGSRHELAGFASAHEEIGANHRTPWPLYPPKSSARRALVDQFDPRKSIRSSCARM